MTSGSRVPGPRGRHDTGDRVAIVGMGCRFAAGVDSAAKFWQFLLGKGRAVGRAPADRWAAYRNHSRESAAVLSRVTAHGAFIDDISGFDAAFFGISATEARQMDPQQRIVLEVAWEALEHAGIPPDELAGTDTAVFMGVGSDDYGRRLLEDLPGIEAWTGIGASLCAVANRISYTLDLRGPSVTVDTACSSSLVALHQACASLLAREARLALVGGMMLMAGPGLTAVLDAAGAISRDGQSKAFDAAADGYGRGEGCGLVVLKRLSEARLDGDRVIAVIRGSAVQQDGRTEGIMAPSREAQEHLLRRAYAAAGVDPQTVDYVEAHGTGTKVGDPIEASVLSAVVGARLAGQPPCLIGSVKTNLGHTEAAAGIAGVMKAALAVQHGLIPPTLTTSGPRADIPWETAGLRLVTETVPWPQTARPRRAGIASYGYGGTIAHAVVEQSPPTTCPDVWRRAVSPAQMMLYPLSAGSPAALTAQAKRLADALVADEGLDLTDLGHTLAHRRSHLPVRAVVAARDRKELVDGLRDLPIRGETDGRMRNPVWVFSGHGAQWAGMGRGLLVEEQAFAEVIDRLVPVYASELGLPLRELLNAADLSTVDRIQSMLYAMQVGLAAVWRHYGVQPGAVIGHSVGEIAAAVAAGVLTESDGARLVCRRSSLLPRVAGRGAMVDDPRSAPKQDHAYWAANLRNPVRFQEAIYAAAVDGHRVFLEVSAHPVVGHSIIETLQANGIHDAHVLPSLRRHKPERDTVLTTLSALHCTGVQLDWRVLQPAGELVTLPSVAWQHKRHWVDVRDGRTTLPADTLIGECVAVHGSPLQVWQTTLNHRTRPYPARHPVLGTEIVPAAVLLTTFFTAGRTVGPGEQFPELADVRLQSPVVVPQENDLSEIPLVRDDVTLRLVSRPYGAADAQWSTHTLATVRPAGTADYQPLGVDASIRAEVLDPGFVIARLAELGVEGMGYPWRIDQLRRGEDALLARVTTDPDGELQERSWAAVLDAALSVASVIFSGPALLRMPAHINRASVIGLVPQDVVISVRLDASHPTTVDVDIQAVDGDGTGRLRGVRYAELAGERDQQEAVGGLRYELRWVPLPVEPAAEPALPGGTVLVLGDAKIAELLGSAATGATVRHASLADPELLRDADQVVVAPMPSGDPLAADAHRAAALLVDVVKAIAARPPGSQPRLWCVTRELRHPRSAGVLASAPLWGMGRVGASEHPEFWGGVVDLPAESEDGVLLARLLHLRPAEPVAAIQTGEVRVPRLAPASADHLTEPLRCRPEGTYLITGGLGALGLHLAHHLAHRGARRLVLLGRTALPPRDTWADTCHHDVVRDRIDAVRQLEASGVTVVTVAADIAELGSTRAALAGLALPPIRGVIHAAGTVDSAMLHALDAGGLRSVMRPKVDGALVLHELFPPGATDFFVLFSSAGPLLGLPGQGAYAAANSFLDGLADHRRTIGARESVSIAWTSWRGLGMSTSAAATDMELEARGTADLRADQALRAFDQTVADLAHTKSGVIAVLPVLRKHTGPQLALFRELARDEPGSAAGVPDWVGLSGEELATHLLNGVRYRVAGVFGTEPEAIGIHRPLSEAGIDSLLASVLRIHLERDMGLPLPATLLWTYPTIADIASYLVRALAEADR